MNINIRMEGGLGDHLLANRFIPAILDKYPNAAIKLFSDTEGNARSLNFLLEAFPSFYQRGGVVINERRNKNYEITTKFGVENYPAHLNNQKQEILNEMLDCDKFYDLHIDGLKWLNYDFDWLRYYYFFPKPQLTFNPGNDYILTHLYARPDSDYNLDQNYVISLLHNLARTKTTVIIVEDKYKDYYSDLINHPNILLKTPDTIVELFELASKCSCFIGIDSGVRYIPYHFSKPTFVYSKYCTSDGYVLLSHLIRWLIFPKNVFPINKSIWSVENLVNQIHENPAYSIFPNIDFNIENLIVQRNF